jgi:UDP-2-acetamido-3-amino-2,3-dideoxy-glucuronate N-acetyltransferase
MSYRQRNIGVIGCGYWGRNLVRNYHELGSLSAICDVNESALTELASLYRVASSTDVDEFLRRPDVRAVAIAAPAAQHFEIAKKAMLAGKDVFIEKPLALHVEEGEELVELSSKLGCILMVGHLLQYHPAIVELRRLLLAGEFGRVNYLYSSRLNFGKLRTEENILWSFAPHDISAILFLLNELPASVTAEGASYLNHSGSDITLTNLNFASGVKAHIFVSWLHPFKEQKLVVVGDRKMAVFNDTEPTRKLVMYPHHVDWVNRAPIACKAEGIEVPISQEEPLRCECLHFLQAVEKRNKPRTDGENGLAVLRILHACEESVKKQGYPVTVRATQPKYFVHRTAIVDQPCEVGDGTHVWHFSHVMAGSKLGMRCNLGQNVHVASGVKIGNNVKIQNNVSVYTGVELEDDVFCGPSTVFTNVINPRSHVNRRNEYQRTLVCKGATLGANSTIVCGVSIGEYAFVAAGAVVTHDIPDYALVMGVPAQQVGWMCQCGLRLPLPFGQDESIRKRKSKGGRNGSNIDDKKAITCTSCGTAYELCGPILQQVVRIAPASNHRAGTAKEVAITA